MLSLSSRSLPLIALVLSCAANKTAPATTVASTRTESASPASTTSPTPDASKPEPASAGSQQGNAAPRPTALPAGTTVLHIGDSFAGALGLDLNRELKAVGVRSILKYQTSSYIPTWASGRELELHLANYNPDLVLVTLGANELQIPDPQERVRTIRKLVSRIGQRPCVWIGPPLWEGARPALLDVIRAECAPCLYLDSTAHLPDLARARDGIHPSGPARTEWAALVVKWLGEHRDPAGERPWTLRQ